MMTPAGRDDLRTRLEWLLFLRVVVVSFFLGTTALVLFTGDPFRMHEQALLFWAVVAVYGLTLVSALVLRRLQHLRLFGYLQIVLDALPVTGVVLITGGAESPFVVLYALPVMHGAALLFTPGAVAGAMAATAGYGALLLSLAWADPAPPGTAELVRRLGLCASGFGAIALLAGALALRLRRTETALAESRGDCTRLEAAHHTLASALDSIVLVSNLRGAILSASDGAAELLGRAPEALLGRHLAEVLPPLAPPRALDRLRMREAASDAVEVSLGSADGGRHGFRCRQLPLADTYDRAIGTLTILQPLAPSPPAAVSPPAEEPLSFEGLISQSESMLQIFRLVERVAPTDSTVLICGESGTGKELIARAIHARSPRHDHLFVAINCGAIPEHLIESELFGHVRGAFTGAVADRPGVFRHGSGGTIFLDEVADLPLHLQVKLLRVLQDHLVLPVGGSRPIPVDVRVLAATNRDLDSTVKAGRFREDLYYRLNVINLSLPPLRNRPHDIPLLVHHFLDHWASRREGQPPDVSPEAMELLLRYPYPGNIRELENIIERMVTLADGTRIEVNDLPPAVRNVNMRPPQSSSSPRHSSFRDGDGGPLLQRGQTLDDELAAAERELLRIALAQAGGVKKRAAELLGINYRSFRHRLSKHGLGADGPDAERDAAASSGNGTTR